MLKYLKLEGVEEISFENHSSMGHWKRIEFKSFLLVYGLWQTSIINGVTSKPLREVCKASCWDLAQAELLTSYSRSPKETKPTWVYQLTLLPYIPVCKGQSSDYLNLNIRFKYWPPENDDLNVIVAMITVRDPSVYQPNTDLEKVTNDRF